MINVIKQVSISFLLLSAMMSTTTGLVGLAEASSNVCSNSVGDTVWTSMNRLVSLVPFVGGVINVVSSSNTRFNKSIK